MQAKLAGAGERGAGGAQGIDGVVKAELAGGAMTVDAQLGTGQGLSSHAHLVLPALASAAPFHIALVRTAPMHGDFAADGEIKPLWTLMMGGERSLSGTVHATGTLSGTIADPQARGAASISGGAFTDAASGLKLTNVSLAAQLDQTSIDVSSVSGQDGVGGSVSGQGRISLERSGASCFRLDLNRFRLIDNDIATATASGQATINRGADGAVKLTGALTIDRADVAANPPTPSGVTPMDVVEVHRPPGTGGHPQAQSDHAPAVALDVALKAPRGVFLKGRGLNLELSLDAHVTGTTETPSLDGTAQVVRGDFDFAGKRFQFDSRGLVYLSTDAAEAAPRPHRHARRSLADRGDPHRGHGGQAPDHAHLDAGAAGRRGALASAVRRVGLAALAAGRCDAGVGRRVAGRRRRLRHHRQPALVRPPRPADVRAATRRARSCPAAST